MTSREVRARIKKMGLDETRLKRNFLVTMGTQYRWVLLDKFNNVLVGGDTLYEFWDKLSDFEDAQKFFKG